MPQTLLSEFYTTQEVAQKLDYTPQHVSRLCKNGKWNAEKFGSEYAIPKSAIDPKFWREQNPDELARYFRARLRIYIGTHGLKLRALGILASGDESSKVYANYLIYACQEVGITLDLKTLPPAKVQQAVQKANVHPEINGIFIFYPILGDSRDASLKASVVPHKDIEGLSPFWMKKLYHNVRFIDSTQTKQAILPCTPLAILKMLEFVGLAPDVSPIKSFKGKKATIFNRSNLVGKPLAHMLKNDGAEVYSFDINGGIRIKGNQKPTPIGRTEALQKSDIIVTGVPSRAFEKIRAEEIKPGAICLNFSFVPNFEENAKIKAGIYVPRVGPMTIAMCLRNMVRLYENYKNKYLATRPLKQPVS